MENLKFFVEPALAQVQIAAVEPSSLLYNSGYDENHCTDELVLAN